jgi:iron uptake system component EfeO
VNVTPLPAKAGLAAVAALLAGISLTSCTAKEPEATPSTDGGKAGPAQITVAASDTACELSGTEAITGPSTFVITNNGSKVQEFYVYGDGERVMGEVENISPGLQRKLVVQLSEPGTYQTACKPGMVGDGLRADFKVTGESVKVDDEGIEPVAESFPNDLDPRIDLREADLEPGQKWTGFHRLEKDLWVTGLQPDSNAMADQLMADAKELEAGVKSPDYKIDSTQIAGGAQGLLDEISRSKITGEEDIFSHTDLWDFKANVDGSQTAVASVRPILDERNADLGKKVDQRFAEVDALLEKYRQGDGFVFYDKVTEPQRQELSRAIDALSKEVSQVQGVIAPK